MNLDINGKRILTDCKAFPVLENAIDVDELDPPLWKSHIGYVGRLRSVPRKEFDQMEHVKVRVQSGRKIREFFGLLIAFDLDVRTKQLSVTFN